MPYYVNQSRLLDIYAILNDGYIEYSEIKTEVGNNTNRQEKTKGTIAAGFKIFNFGVNGEKDDYKEARSLVDSKIKKVQTVSSVLSIVKTELEEKGYLKPILEAQIGQFICLDVNLTINSIKSLMNETLELTKLTNSMMNLNQDGNKKKMNTKQIEEIANATKSLFDGEEIIYQNDSFAIIGNIVDDYLYQSYRSDIIKTDLQCLAQIKRIFPEGTELLRNTMFSKMRDEDVKSNLINAIMALSNGNYDYEAKVIPSIVDKMSNKIAR